MDKKNVLTVKNLKKNYKKNSSQTVKAIENLNLEVKQGESFGVLGRNGVKNIWTNQCLGI